MAATSAAPSGWSAPRTGPQTCLAVLSAFNPDVKGQQIDLQKTYTNQFVQAAKTVS